MVHIGALPGTPKSYESVEKIKVRALNEAQILEEAGVDGVMLENMHDVPYQNRKVKEAIQIPVIIGSGINTNSIHKYWDLANAFIVGSSFKDEGKWQNEVRKSRVNIFMSKINELRK